MLTLLIGGLAVVLMLHFAIERLLALWPPPQAGRDYDAADQRAQAKAAFAATLRTEDEHLRQIQRQAARYLLR